MRIWDIKKEIPLPEGKALENIFEGPYLKDVSTIEETNVLQRNIFDFLKSLSNAIGFYERSLKEVMDPKDGAYDIFKLQNLTLEFNDALNGSTLNLFKVCKLVNIEVEDIYRYYEKFLTEGNLHEAYLFSGNSLKTILCYARHENIQEGNAGLKRLSFNLKPQPNFDKPFSHAGRVIGIDLYNTLNIQSFSIFHNSIQLTNLLESSPRSIQENVMGIFIQYFKLMDLVGATEESIYEVNYLNNEINKA